jgi:hypothetical protein
VHGGKCCDWHRVDGRFSASSNDNIGLAEPNTL